MKCVNDASETGDNVNFTHQPPFFMYSHVRGHAANLVCGEITYRRRLQALLKAFLISE
jgi:hypothetical protein